MASDGFPLFVVLNPKAGRKLGPKHLSQVVQPTLERSGIPFRVIETTAGGHAQSYFKNFTQSITASEIGLGDTEGATVNIRIMAIGGDGTVHEIVNGVIEGLAARPSTADSIRLKVEFSIVPAGTGNAIATSLNILNAQDAVSRFLAGNSVPLQVIKVSKRHPDSQSWAVQLYSVVVNSFGLHCATVQDAEALRFLGNERFKIAALKNIILLKQYEGSVDLFGPIQRYNQDSREMVSTSDGSSEVSPSNPSHTLKGPFTYLMLTKQASLEPGFQPTPFAKTWDEWIDVLAVQNASRGEILQVLGDATKGGGHIDHEKVEYYKVKAVELETPTKSHLCVDGEFLEVEAGPQGRLRFEVALGSSTRLFHVYS
ncbi:hypothetical protein BGZ46_003253 [Entomortierella lignicola]|nr:hypothetical protein BGZ46_003253 [Entomortierella lignicola]